MSDSMPQSFKKRVGSSTSRLARESPGHIDLPRSPYSDQTTPTHRNISSPSSQMLRSGRVSSGARRASKASRNVDPFASDNAEGKEGETKAAVPNLIPGFNPPIYSTPLPKIPIVVLCICMLAEFLSASTPAAFMYFQIEEFFTRGMQDPPAGIESQVAFWNGIVSSVFFLAQFLTSLLWASIAQKHGRRIVLLCSLLGNACSLSLFGTSKNVPTAIITRFGQGIFCGAVGVARGAARDITDSTNEARAYSLIGLSWGLGGVIGPLIGGLTEHPVDKFPFLFRDNALLAKYPYFLPCFLSSLICLTGAFLTLFLNKDGGPREGAIQLPTEKEVEEARAAMSLPRRALNRVSGYFQTPARMLRSRTQSSLILHSPANEPTEETALSPNLQPVDMRSSMHSRRPSGVRMSQYGTSYGYEPRSYKNWANRRYTNQSNAVSQAQLRRGSMAASTVYAPDYDTSIDESNLNFAQRLLLANEAAVFNISDLWVNTAIAQDDQYSQADWAEEQSVFEDDEEEYDDANDISGTSSRRQTIFSEYGSEPPSLENLRLTAARQATGDSSSDLLTPGRRRMTQTDGEATVRKPGLASLGAGPDQLLSPRREMSGRRRVSAASTRPAILANTGLASDIVLPPSAYEAAPVSEMPNLASIPEGKMPQLSPAAANTPLMPFPPQTVAANRSPLWDLPLSIIAQLFMLALHGVGCDQIFMTFLVTPVSSGGLGLNAAHYSQLVATMVWFNMFWQFKVYPNLGPPRGKLSHLAMMRLGLSLYIPVYVFFPQLRSLYTEKTNAAIMAGMIVLSAFRYLANTCAYTSIMVLTNAMSPPHMVAFSNGLAQSAASAARFCGPVLGGTLWSWAIKDGPTARPWPLDYHFPFYVVACICFTGLMISTTIR